MWGVLSGRKAVEAGDFAGLSGTKQGVGTRRAQAVGDAFTLVTAEDLAMIESIERFIGMKIPRLKLDGFDYKYTALLDPSATHVKARAAGGGRHRSGYSFGIKRRR